VARSASSPVAYAASKDRDTPPVFARSPTEESGTCGDFPAEDGMPPLELTETLARRTQETGFTCFFLIFRKSAFFPLA